MQKIKMLCKGVGIFLGSCLGLISLTIYYLAKEPRAVLLAAFISLFVGMTLMPVAVAGYVFFGNIGLIIGMTLPLVGSWVYYAEGMLQMHAVVTTGHPRPDWF